MINKQAPRGLSFLCNVFFLSVFALSVPAPLLAGTLPVPYGMPHYTGTIFPTPQQVIYHDDYVPLSRVAVLLGKGLKTDDARVNILQQRLKHHGCEVTVVEASEKTAGFPVVLALGDTDFGANVSPPDREQGYIITPGRRGGQYVIVFKGADHQGLLWAIASFNQLVTVKDDKPVARLAKVTDYPAVLRRGFIGRAWHNHRWHDDIDEPDLDGRAWYIAAFKLNYMHLGGFQRNRPRGNWRNITEENKRIIQRTGELLTPLGIEWYMGYNPLPRARVDHNRPEFYSKLSIEAGHEWGAGLDAGSDEDFQTVLDHALLVYEAGGSFQLKFDDYRFGLLPLERERFGTAREADVYFLKKLHSAISGRYPDAHLLFCPVFYWGPRGGVTYNESRDEYLKAIGELPETISFFWTGPRVGASTVQRSDVEWITGLIKRKPVFWQNLSTGGAIPREPRWPWPADVQTWWQQVGYDGFYDDLRAYLPNAPNGMPDAAALTLTLCDYLWNPDAFDPERSAREANNKLFGPAVYDMLVEIRTILDYFQQWHYQVTPAAAADIGVLRKKLEQLDALWERANELSPDDVRRWSRLMTAPNLMRRYVERLERDPNLTDIIEKVAIIRDQADQELDLRDDDIFIAPNDFSGGAAPAVYAFHCEPRSATWIHGAGSGMQSMKASFRVEPWPVENDFILIISGQDHDVKPDPARIRISVGENILFEGPNGFKRRDWSMRSFRMSGAELQRANTIEVKCMEDSPDAWFMLNYAVVRPVSD